MIIRNIIFSALTCSLLCSIFLLSGAKAIGYSLPDWLDPEPAKYLSGGFSPTHMRESLTLINFLDKDLQTQIEKKIENQVPAKASVLLGESAVQRLALAASGTCIRAPYCLPTFYGSPIVLDTSQRALFQMPLKDTNGVVTTEVGEFAHKLAELAADFPNKEFVVIVADNSNTSSANPAVRLSSNAFTTQDGVSIFQNATWKASNIHTVDVSQTRTEKYLKLYYRTDHHWNGWGALEAYRGAIDVLLADSRQLKSVTLAQIENLPHLEGCEWLVENGSSARTGLCLLNEKVDEPLLPLGGIEVEQGATPPVASGNGLRQLKKAGAVAGYDFYQTWYGQWTDSRLTNHNAPMSGSSALIICDSFGTAFKWVASTGFERVDTKYDLHDSRDDATNLRQTLSKSDCDTVFLIGRITSFQLALSRFPEYLN